ncbi:serine/threonine-protein phosphatase [bacterium]|nr:serine/threonine-protein phosphatase [candidate division CSSED10-310 bacterium]
MEAFGQTDIGCKRSVNQDAFHIDRERAMFIVADGMGGHQAGDLASRLAIRAILDFLAKQVPIDTEDQDIDDMILIHQEMCRSAVICANSELYKIAEDRPELFGMGTTIDMMKIVGGYGIICHVGDSRIYRISNGEITQLTKDHTQIQEMLDQHQISQRDAEFYTLKNVITRALGGSEDILVDTLVVPIHLNDVFLLCTDGLSGVMEDWELCEEFGMYEKDIEQAVKGYIQTTLDRGAPDNVTVLLAGPASETDAIDIELETVNQELLKDLLGSNYLD